jgi:polyphosphate kinase
MPEMEERTQEQIEATLLDDPSLLFNRELSWLAFNARVLDEAKSPRIPLLERLKFIAIHAANLDEFFMIRVSALHDQLEAAITELSPDGLTAAEQLRRIRVQILEQLDQVSNTLNRDILPGLKLHGIELTDWDALDPAARERAERYFRSTVFPVLTPLAVDPGHPFPFLSNLSLSLAVEVRDPHSQERKFARVKVPESLPRFIAVDNLDKSAAPSTPRESAGLRVLPLEQLIEANLSQLFPELEILGHYPFRITRDMDY